MTEIHHLAVVDKQAKIGENVKIGPFCIVGPNVQIGDNCVLETNVRLDGYTTIGKNNRFHHSAVVGTACQDLKYKGEPTKLIIGDNNTFREFVTVNPSATLDEDTTIGSNCLIMAYCHIAHNCHVGNNVIMANVATLAGHVTVGDFVTIGGLSAVHQFVTIGDYTFIGGKSGVKKDVPPYIRGEGMPFKPHGLNSVGLQRRGFSSESIEKIKQIYKVFYHSKLNVTQALEAIAKMDYLSIEQQNFVEFVKNSERGIAI
ncbi:MAG: acyl-ACP--UDP-N-acetylglucosamine O-acyltransferase [Candidatus Cloacimonas sp.]|nr:acyl-ACP--UDP-N-acetylglucosamine O-acyltransferase [Candidatus Cloacimonadota bacterium]